MAVLNVGDIRLEGGSVTLWDGVSWVDLATVLGAAGGTAPAGSMMEYAGAVAPTGWLLMNGQTVAGADTLYPALWAVAPAAWKSGSSLTIPNRANTVGIGAGTTALGALGGSTSKTIEAANLPPHAHAGDTGTVSADHSHHIDFVSSVDGELAGSAREHSHGPGLDASGFVTDGGMGAPVASIPVTGGSYILNAGTDSALIPAPGFTAVGRHNHWVEGDTQGISANHSHAFTTDDGPGDSTPLTLPPPPHLAVNYIIKAS